jgi:HAD superfamily hydrolase (TIGR01509 family)
MIRGVLFDFSGTLVNCGDAWLKLELVTTVRAPLTLLRQRGAVSVTDDQLDSADELYKAMKQTARDTGVEISAQEATRQAARELGLSLPDKLIDDVVDELFYACLPDAAPLDGAGAALQQLQQRGLTLAVISNARHGAFVPRALERLDMTRYLRTIVVSADVHLRKPRPEIYWNTLTGLGLSPSEAAYVGDYHPFDIVGANAAGLSSIWLVEPGRPHDDLPARVVISRLDQLGAALDSLSAQ